MNKFIQKGKFRKAAGSIVAPENSGLRFVFNPIDFECRLDSDLAKILASKWKKPREEAKGWQSNHIGYKMGEIQTVPVQSDVWVVNALSLGKDGIDLTELDKALKKTADLALYEKASVHMHSSIFLNDGVEALVQARLIDQGINVYLYR